MKQVFLAISRPACKSAGPLKIIFFFWAMIFNLSASAGRTRPMALAARWRAAGSAAWLSEPTTAAEISLGGIVLASRGADQVAEPARLEARTCDSARPVSLVQ